MPVVEQKAGSCYVWIIVTFLFICVTAGGILLAIYMSQPDASSWYPIVGITLVCLPWFFWFLTFLYRVLSRRLGFRMVCWGTSVDSLPRTTTAPAGSAAIANGGQSSMAELEPGGSTPAEDGGRKVRFGDAVVLGEEHDDNESARLSHESEAPLRHGMAS